MVRKCFYVCSRVLGSGFATTWLVEMYLYIITSGRKKLTSFAFKFIRSQNEILERILY